MKNLRVVLLALGASILAFSGWAKSETATLVKTRSAYSDAVTLGKWHCNYTKAKKFAIDNKVPLIAVWSKGDTCGHCVSFESSCNSSTFKNWQKTSGMVFYFISYEDRTEIAAGNIESDVFHWCRKNKNTSYPFVRIYWPAGGVDVATVGDTMDKQKSGKTGGKNVVDYLKDKLSKFKPTPVTPAYVGGSFAVTNGILQAEIGNTTFVDVPVVRTGASTIAKAYVNKVVIAYPDGVAVTNDLDWAQNDSEKTLTVEIGSAHGLAKDGAKVTLTLLDSSAKAIAASAKAVDTTDITMVTEPENSPKNPRWIGERTSETLAFGEWTMDIDAATNKQDRAHTLLLFGGPLWCPDCINVEEKLFATKEFNTWAQDNKIVCVAIDEAPFAADLDAPTLLSREMGPNWASVSGAGYISRKMIPIEGNGGTNAMDIAARNLAYVQKDTAHGGYCTPDNLDGTGNAGIWGTGIPCVIALRKDGSVAGRLYQFSNDFRSPGVVDTPVEVLLKRLDELFAQDAEDDARFTNEDLNDSRRTTPESIGMRETVEERTLSFIDGADVYRLKPEETYGRRINFTLDADPGVGLALDVITVSGSNEKIIASTSGPTCPIDIGANVNSTNAYVKVHYLKDANGYSIDPQFALTNGDSTVFAYSLTTDFVVEPTEVGETVTLADRSEMTLALVSNEVYRITNFAGLAGVLEATTGSTNNLFRALVTDDVQLTLTGMSAEVQLWHPGQVGFAVKSATTLETFGSYSLRLVREGGVSGRAVLKLSKNTDPAKTTAFDDQVVLPENFEEEIVWENGDDADKTVTILVPDNKFADGNKAVCFDAAVSGNAGTGIDEMTLTIRDDDKKVPGRIAIVETTPSLAKGMTAYARQGDEMTIVLEREDGADGEQAVTLSTTAGTLDATEFAWSSRTMDRKTATLTLPKSGKSVKVTVTPAKGSTVDASRRILTVNLLDSDVPGFVRSEVSESATRYVPIETIAVAVDPAHVADWSKIKVAKFSGSLPSGVTWKLEGADTKQLVVSGVPTQAGSFTAVFRVSSGSTAGLTVSVSLDVVDPVVTGGGDAGVDPLNASVKSSRTFSNVPVWDVTAKVLAGQLTLTVPRTGKLSAKYLTVDAPKAVSFSCKSWSEIAADGTLKATLTGKVGANDASIDVTVPAKGVVTATLTEAGRAGDTLVVDIPENVWSKKNPATDFKGYYTVQLPAATVRSGNLLATGCGYVTLKMTAASDVNAGKFAYAGLLPNGKSFSGTATLCAKDWLDDEDFKYWSRGVLPILTVTSSDTVAGAVEINPGAFDVNAKDYDGETGLSAGRCYYKLIRRVVRPARETEPVANGGALLWRHVEKVAEVSSEALLDVWGAYYDEKDDFLTDCKNALGTGSLKLFALSGLNELPEALIGGTGVDGALAKGVWDEAATNAVAGVTVTFAKASKSAKTKTSAIKTASSTKLPLTFTLSSGILSGTFKLPMETGSVTFTYKGVVLPGFGYGNCSACGIDVREGGVEAAAMPFAAGTAWVNDTFSYSENGKVRKLTVRRSTPFSIGVNPGE